MKHALISQARTHRQAGWSLVETLVVMLIMGTVGAISVLVMPGVIALAKADSAAGQLQSALRVAREQAISQRRNMRLDVIVPRTLVISRVEVPGPAVTEVSRMTLEGGMQFVVFAGVPDTPDGFGNAGIASFGGATSVAFTSEGTLVDQNGDEANGSLFVGVPNQPHTARAVTVFGPTALVREWRWQGNDWAH